MTLEELKALESIPQQPWMDLTGNRDGEVYLDASYSSGWAAHFLDEHEIKGVVGLIRLFPEILALVEAADGMLYKEEGNDFTIRLIPIQDAIKAFNAKLAQL